MVKRIMMKHDKAQRKMKREAIKSDEEAMNTMHEDEDEDSMNQLGEDRKKKEENDMNEMKSDNDTDMNRELGEGVDNDEDHHHKEKRRQSRKLGDSQESGAAAQVEAEAKEIAGGKEPFNSEPVTGEDGDQHFVMTDKLRRKELQEAAYGKSESTPERQEASIAEETERERRAISMYQAMDEKKRIADQKRERMHRYVEKKLSEHSLMRDSKGRVVPNV